MPKAPRDDYLFVPDTQTSKARLFEALSQATYNITTGIAAKERQRQDKLYTDMQSLLQRWNVQGLSLEEQESRLKKRGLLDPLNQYNNDRVKGVLSTNYDLNQALKDPNLTSDQRLAKLDMLERSSYPSKGYKDGVRESIKAYTPLFLEGKLKEIDRAQKVQIDTTVSQVVDTSSETLQELTWNDLQNTVYNGSTPLQGTASSIEKEIITSIIRTADEAENNGDFDRIEILSQIVDSHPEPSFEIEDLKKKLVIAEENAKSIRAKQEILDQYKRTQNIALSYASASEATGLASLMEPNIDILLEQPEDIIDEEQKERLSIGIIFNGEGYNTINYFANSPQDTPYGTKHDLSKTYLLLQNEANKSVMKDVLDTDSYRYKGKLDKLLDEIYYEQAKELSEHFWQKEKIDPAKLERELEVLKTIQKQKIVADFMVNLNIKLDNYYREQGKDPSDYLQAIVPSELVRDTFDETLMTALDYVQSEADRLRSYNDIEKSPPDGSE